MSSMKVMLFGALGMLGCDLSTELTKNGVTVIPITKKICDITKIEDVILTIQSEPAIDYVINCAAYTNVDLAETEQELANLINGEAISHLLKACKKYEIPFVHISTDYVFDGTKKHSAYIETDVCKPINAYGYSKWIGEQHCLNSTNHYYIFRVQWLYGVNGHNFIKTMTELMSKKQELSIVADQWGSPTSTVSLARYIIHVLAKKPAYGIYHCTDKGVTTWYEFATEIGKQIGYTGLIKPVKSVTLSRPAKRPKNGRLNCQKLITSTKLNQINWQEMVMQYLDKIKIKEN